MFNYKIFLELSTQKIVTQLSKIWIRDPGSGKNPIPDPGVKSTGSQIRNTDRYLCITRERTYKDVVADIAELLLHLLPVFLGHLLLPLASLQSLEKVKLKFNFLVRGSDPVSDSSNPERKTIPGSNPTWPTKSASNIRPDPGGYKEMSSILADQ